MRNLSELQEVYERVDESLVCLEKLLTEVENECPSFFSAPVSNMSASEMLAIARDLLKLKDVFDGGTRYLYVSSVQGVRVSKSAPSEDHYQSMRNYTLRVWRIDSDKVEEIDRDGVRRRVTG